MRTISTARDTGIGGFVISTDPCVLDTGLTVTAPSAVVGDLVLFGASGHPTDLIGTGVTVIPAAMAAKYWKRANAGTYVTKRIVGVGGEITAVTDNGSDNYDVETDNEHVAKGIDMPEAPQIGAILIIPEGTKEIITAVPAIESYNWFSPGPALPTTPAQPSYAPYGFDPDNCNSNLVLSNNNLTINSTLNGPAKGCLADFIKTSGKWYWEIVIEGSINWPKDNAFGWFLPETFVDNVNVGNNILTEGMYWAAVSSLYSYNGATYGDTFSVSGSLGNVLCIAWDADAGLAWCYANNAPGGGADPATGVTPTLTFRESYVGKELRWGITIDDTTSQATAHFAAADLTYDPPVGYSVLT